MKIEVINKNMNNIKDVPSNSVTLLLKKKHIYIGKSKIPIVILYDETGDYIPVSVKLTHIQKRIPSSLLSRWINTNFQDKLIELQDRANTIEKIDFRKENTGEGRWFFTNKENSIYGLHRISIKESLHNKYVKFCVVKIDDSIGMQSVNNILKELAFEIECCYDIKTEKMKQIILKGDFK